MGTSASKAKTQNKRRETRVLRFHVHSAELGIVIRPRSVPKQTSTLPNGARADPLDPPRDRALPLLQKGRGTKRKRKKNERKIIGRRKSPLSRARGIGNLAQKQWIERRFVDAREAAIKRRTCRWCEPRRIYRI